MEATTSKEDILVALQTENGEQIALPISALPSDFVPGDSGQIIMVEGTLEERQQEVVVESEVISPPTPRKKQKRKETLVTRPLNEEDIELKFQIIDEPSHLIQEIEVKRKPRKEYRTKKKVRLAMEKMLNNANTNPIEAPEIEPDPEPEQEMEHEPEPELESQTEPESESLKRESELPKRDLPRRGARKDYRIFAGLQGKKRAFSASGAALTRGDTKFA